MCVVIIINVDFPYNNRDILNNKTIIYITYISR